MHKSFLIGLCLLIVFLAPLLALPPRAFAEAPATYVVRWGDTLFSIATRYGTTVEALLAANQLSAGDFIYVGQRLVIPGQSPAPALSASNGLYTVQAGDTLYSIATRYGTTVNALMQANNLYNYWIYTGQQLRLPGAPAPYVPPPAQSEQGLYYVVRPGDYLALIAWRFNTTVYAIQIANNLYNASFIWVGQRLYIPGVEPTYQPPAFSQPEPNPPLGGQPNSLPPGSEPQPEPNPPPGGQPNALPPGPEPQPEPNPFPVEQPNLFPPFGGPHPGVLIYYPHPTPIIVSNRWEAVVISDTNSMATKGPCYIQVIVYGKEHWPVVVASLDGSYESEPKFTGDKPEISPYATEFAHACTGTWRVIPLGLNIAAEVTLNGGHTILEFRQVGQP